MQRHSAQAQGGGKSAHHKGLQARMLLPHVVQYSSDLGEAEAPALEVLAEERNIGPVYDCPIRPMGIQPILRTQDRQASVHAKRMHSSQQEKTIKRILERSEKYKFLPHIVYACFGPASARRNRICAQADVAALGLSNEHACTKPLH